MQRERLYLFDTTLRDGAQTNGVDFTLADKLVIADMLARLGVDYVEGGYPGANPTDTQLFAEDRAFATTFTAFGMTRRPGRSASNDPGLASGTRRTSVSALHASCPRTSGLPPAIDTAGMVSIAASGQPPGAGGRCWRLQPAVFCTACHAAKPRSRLRCTTHQ